MYKVGKTSSLEEAYLQYPELKRKDVEEIVNWTHNQSHLPMITEYEAALFLHGRRYNVNDAKKIIDIYFKYRTNNPKMFSNRDAEAPEVQNVVNCQVQIPCPEPTADGSKMFFLKVVDSSASKFNLAATMKTLTMLIDYWHMTEGFVPGHVVCVDMQGFTFGHLIRVNPMTLRTFVIFAQDILPVRIKGIHFLNGNRITQRLITILKPFLKKEIYDMIHIHTTMESAFEYIPRGNFSTEMGGSWKTYSQLQDDMRNILLSNKEIFIADETERRLQIN
ncbi:clavesin-2-like [Phlebotomus argentipes]|uniref:clavesin-2-like n=1 Tax=Phlebotomus argentipes TaxID=94469 RepID=UPI0028930FF4|nr:clavesin-2-like [Phlebotomus argentipes]